MTTVRILKGLTCAFFCGASMAHSQGLPGSVEAGGEAGRLYGGSLAKGTNQLFDHRVQLDDDKLKGFWLGTRLTPEWGLEVAIRRSTTQLIEPNPGIFASQKMAATLDFGTIELLGVRTFHLGRFEPYLLGGAGIANLDINVPDRSRRDTNRFSMAVGGGARFWMSSCFGFRFDVRARAVYLEKRSGGEDQGAFDVGRWLRVQEITAGAFLSFGGK